MFWTDDTYNRIWMANLNGSNATILIGSDLSCPGWDSLSKIHSCGYLLDVFFVIKGGIAWDWITKKLYWTDSCKDVIEVYDFDNGQRRVLLNTGSNSNNKDIVVDPTTG